MRPSDLARAIDKSKAAVSEYLSGKHVPPLGVLQQIAEATGTSIRTLVA